MKTLVVRFRSCPDDGKGRVPYENTWCVFGNGFLVTGGFTLLREATKAAMKFATERNSWHGSSVYTVSRNSNRPVRLLEGLGS